MLCLLFVDYGQNITQLHKDWVVYHYVGVHKKFTMSKLIDAVHLEVPCRLRPPSLLPPARCEVVTNFHHFQAKHYTIYQKKLRITTQQPQTQWKIKEIELYRDTCGSPGSKNSLAKVC